MMEARPQVSPVITERRNSLIVGTRACPAAGPHHRATALTTGVSVRDPHPTSMKCQV